MILKMIHDPELSKQERDDLITGLVGGGWHNNGEITTIKEIYLQDSPYDFYYDGGQWQSDDYFGNIVAGLEDRWQLVSTLYVVPINIEVDTDAFVRDAEALLKGLPRP